MESLISGAVFEFVWSLFSFLRPALALFNMLLLFWLGLTVLIQVERRRSSVWFASFSLLLAAAFFGAYTIEMGGGPAVLLLDLFWVPALIVLHILPLCWHIVVLYFVGQFDPRIPSGSGREAFRRWPRGVLPYFVLATFVATPIALLQTGGVPGMREFATGELPYAEAPLAYTSFLLLFSAYILSSTLGSLGILTRHRFASGSLQLTARQRARASFLGAGLALVGVSVVVTALVLYFLFQHHFVEAPGRREILAIFRFDAPLALLIAIAVWFTGRATIYYELFSGALPRRGLFLQWHLAVAFALAAGVFFALLRWFFGTGGFTVLGTSLLAMFAFVLLGRSHNRERNLHLAFMRPFLGSQNLYETVLHNESNQNAVVTALTPPVPFAALCRDVLSASRAFLYPIGEARPFVESALSYPADLEDRPEDPEELEQLQFEPHRRFQPLDPGRYGGAMLAIPLWSRSGVAGVLLLGEQTGGGLYTQEEVEIAQAAGERIIDTLAVARISRIMLSLQRSRIIEGRLGDDRARRILHDDVLPEIHAILLALTADDRLRVAGILDRLTAVHGQISQLLREMPITTHPEVLRLGLSEALRHAAEREGGFDRIVWQSDAEAERFVGRQPAQVQETVFYAAREMLRNASRHARRPDAELELRFQMRMVASGANQQQLAIVIEDNGGGMRERADTRGTGQGISLHGAMLAVVGGSLSMETRPGRYTRAHIRLRAPARNVAG